MSEYIAHENQTLLEHLTGVSQLCRKNAAKIGLDYYGEILGLLHDLGKYSKQFQDYIKSVLGLLNPEPRAGAFHRSARRGTLYARTSCPRVDLIVL